MTTFRADEQRRRYRASLVPLAERQDWRCPWCKKRLPRDLLNTHKDHIIPIARGGPELDWNFQILHGTCNGQKRERMTDEAVALAAEHGITLLPPIVRPPKPSRYTPEAVGKMASRRAAGESYEAIAADYGCSAIWVYGLIRRLKAGTLPRYGGPFLARTRAQRSHLSVAVDWALSRRPLSGTSSPQSWPVTG